MKLKIIEASHNDNITDEGIKDMYLDTLIAVNNYNITKQGIKHMKGTVNKFLNITLK